MTAPANSRAIILMTLGIEGLSAVKRSHELSFSFIRERGCANRLGERIGPQEGMA